MSQCESDVLLIREQMSLVPSSEALTHFPKTSIVCPDSTLTSLASAIIYTGLGDKKTNRCAQSNILNFFYRTLYTQSPFKYFPTIKLLKSLIQIKINSKTSVK